MKTTKEILKEKLSWQPDLLSERNFITDSYSKEECYLQMNDFPDEPLWTLFYLGNSIDFDDTPKNWSITYRSEL